VLGRTNVSSRNPVKLDIPDMLGDANNFACFLYSLCIISCPALVRLRISRHGETRRRIVSGAA
jgi:hypothetical protein